MNHFAPLVFAVALLPVAAHVDIAQAQRGPRPRKLRRPCLSGAWSTTISSRRPIGAPFQIASGRIAEEKAATSDIRDYAHLMVVTGICWRALATQ
jgi:hypothetical protein